MNFRGIFFLAKLFDRYSDELKIGESISSRMA